MLIKGERAPWTTLGELLAQRAAQRNDALWIEVDGNRLTWHEVERHKLRALPKTDAWDSAKALGRRHGKSAGQ